MKQTDFSFSGITKFTPTEIEATGASLEDVQLGLFLKLEKVRNKLRTPIHLLKNGLTTGDHKCKEHPQGKAVDFTTRVPLSIPKLLTEALNAGFRGVGIYWNGKTFSYHLDLREEPNFWIGTKKKPNEDWTYTPLLKDIKTL